MYGIRDESTGDSRVKRLNPYLRARPYLRISLSFDVHEYEYVVLV